MRGASSLDGWRGVVSRAEMQLLATMRRLRPLILAGVLFIAATPASAATSHAKIWTALGNDLGCGVAIHPPGKPPTQVVCSDRTIPPPPHGVGYGDPGFVFLGAHGHPILHAPPRTPSKAPTLSRSPPDGHGATSA